MYNASWSESSAHVQDTVRYSESMTREQAPSTIRAGRAGRQQRKSLTIPDLHLHRLLLPPTGVRDATSILNINFAAPFSANQPRATLHTRRTEACTRSTRVAFCACVPLEFRAGHQSRCARLVPQCAARLGFPAFQVACLHSLAMGGRVLTRRDFGSMKCRLSTMYQWPIWALFGVKSGGLAAMAWPAP
jgi:hypothetical protein